MAAIETNLTKSGRFQNTLNWPSADVILATFGWLYCGVLPGSEDVH